MRRWVKVGHGPGPDASTAAARAARIVTSNAAPGLLLVFSSPRLGPAAVLEGIREVVADDVPIIGCSTHGEIFPGGPADDSVVIIALGGPGFSVHTVTAHGVNGRQREAGREIALQVPEAATGEHPHRVLVTLTDGFIRDQEEILRGVYSVLGASVPVFGGAAADGWEMSGRTYQLFGTSRTGQVLGDSVVAAVISSDAPMGLGIRHGWKPVGEPMVVTAAAAGRVLQLDDEPALDVYLERLGAGEAVHHDREAFTAFALPRPVGIQRRGGIELRNLSTEPDIEGRSIGGGGAIAEGGLIWIMEGDPGTILEASGAACVDALGGLDGREALGMLTFSCAASRAVIGDAGIAREGEVFTHVAGGVPFGGFYTYGEIARTRGIDGFHNQSVVALAFA